MAYLLAANASIEQKVVYIVPTRTLANEAFKILSEMIDTTQTPLAITTRERTEVDEKLTDFAVIIATYEKFDSLLRTKRLSKSNMKCVIADEVHFISNKQRGIPLEFTLSQLKEKTNGKGPQIVALSAMINAEDTIQMSEWLTAASIRSEWRPVDLDEMIFYNGNLYHKKGEITQIRPTNQIAPSDQPDSKTTFDRCIKLSQEKT